MASCFRNIAVPISEDITPNKALRAGGILPAQRNPLGSQFTAITRSLAFFTKIINSAASSDLARLISASLWTIQQTFCNLIFSVIHCPIIYSTNSFLCSHYFIQAIYASNIKELDEYLHWEFYTAKPVLLIKEL